MAKKKKLTGKRLTKALDDAIRDYFKVCYGDNPQCYVCGRFDSWYSCKDFPMGIQVGHFIARKRTIVRWNLLNLFPQCSSCNIIHNNNLLPFTLAIINKEGITRLTYLNDTVENFYPNRMTLTEKRDLLQALKDFTDGSSDVIVY